MRRNAISLLYVLVFGLVSGVLAEEALAEARPLAELPEISVRLRPLNGLTSVTGQNLALYSTGLRARVFQSQGHQAWQLRFETLQGEPAWNVVDRDSGRSLARIQGRFAEIRGANVRVDLRPAPLHLRLVATKSNVQFDLQLVGLLSLDDYVHGVVSAEVPRDWPLEALKAQAVAARSFALAKLRERAGRGRDWMLEATIMDQVFDHSKKHGLAEEAVVATRGEVLIGPKGVAVAHYHSDCGGHTDEPRAVWGGGEVIGTASDGCAKRASSSWRMVADLNEMTKKLREQGKIVFQDRVSALNIVHRTEGGRAKSIRLTSKSGGSTTVTGEELRAALGYMNLRSTKFDVRTLGDRAEFKGRGFGHGTGLCQWGARGLAVKGYDYRSILKHYYPRLRLESTAKSSELLATL